MKPIDYRAHFARHGLTCEILDAACARAIEKLNRQFGQRVRRALDAMRLERRG